MTCRTCHAPLGRKNKSGYCKRHVSAAQAADPAFREKQRAGILRKIATDPAYAADLKRRARVQGERLDTRAARSARFSELQVWKVGHAIASSPELRAKAGQSLSRTRNAWCPPELLGAYRELTALGYRAAEARALILDQHARDMARFTAKIAPAPTPRAEAPAIDLAQVENIPDDPVLAVAALLDVCASDVLSAFRDRPLVDARAVAAVVMRRQGLSFPAIGRKLGRDHTSIVNLVQSFDARTRQRPHLLRVVERLAA